MTNQPSSIRGSMLADQHGLYKKQPWRVDAECGGTNPSLFYPEQDDHVTEITAKAICGACVVKVECLEYALEAREEHGIWGGATAKERKRLRRQRSYNSKNGLDN